MAVGTIKLDYAFFGIGIHREGFKIKTTNPDFAILNKSDSQKYFQFPQGIDIAKDSVIYEIIRFYSPKNPKKYIFILKKCIFSGFESDSGRPCYYGCALLFESGINGGLPNADTISLILEDLSKYSEVTFNESKKYNQELTVQSTQLMPFYPQSDDAMRGVLAIDNSHLATVDVINNIFAGGYAEYRRLFFTSSEEILKNSKNQIEKLNWAGIKQTRPMLLPAQAPLLLRPQESSNLEDESKVPAESGDAKISGEKRDSKEMNIEDYSAQEDEGHFAQEDVDDLFGKSNRDERTKKIATSDLLANISMRLPKRIVMVALQLILGLWCAYLLYKKISPVSTEPIEIENEDYIDQISLLRDEIKSQKVFNQRIEAELEELKAAIVEISKSSNDRKTGHLSTYHRVRKGETIDGIARMFNLKPEELAEDNKKDIKKISDTTYIIRDGASLFIRNQ